MDTMTKTKRLSLVIEPPTDPESRELVETALGILGPYLRSVKDEDCIAILQLIESHPGFDERIAEVARERCNSAPNPLPA